VGVLVVFKRVLSSILALALAAAGALIACAGTPGVSTALSRSDMGEVRPVQAGSSAWLQPPPVLPLPSPDGAEGPPRPYGAEPPPGPTPAPTSSRFVRAQNHALLYGPFSHGGLARGISDPSLIMSSSATVRVQTLARIRAAGASVVRIPVEWRYTVSPDPPAGFDASDAASPFYDFGAVDAAVRDTAAAGLTPLLVVTRAPAFAEAPHRWRYAYPGSWAPDPVAFGEFASAVARRYDGSFPDPLELGRALPRVRLYEAWNEPNLARYLGPQWVAVGGRWRAFSPLLYRQLLDAFYAAVKAVAPSDTVIAGGVAPNGEPAGIGRITPLRFLSGLLCLEGRRRAACSTRPHFDVLAFHPLSFEGPDLPAHSSQDVAISDIAKVTALLGRAERLGTVLPRGRKPVWVTELNWESAPQSAHGVPGRLQALWISRALHRLWVAGVGLADWQFLIDPYPDLTLATPTGGTIKVQRPAGLYSAGVVDGRAEPAAAQPKPFLRGFMLPFDPLRVDRGHVRVWALLMRPRQPATLERGTRARASSTGVWRTIADLRADGSGVLNVLVSLRGAADLRLASGTLVSPSEQVPPDRSRL
jgi:hypothetical protein